MNFELPEQDVQELEPLREEFEQIGTNWRVPLNQIENLVAGNSNLEEMLEDVLDQCVRYTKTVLEQQETLLTEGRGEDHAEKDMARSITHTATQDTLRAFARNLIRSGKTATDIYPLLPNTESRASCGQFALRLTLSRGVKTEQSK